MVHLELLYGIEEEVERVKETLGELPWFKENGYTVLYPEGLSEKSTDDEIRTAVRSGYDGEAYRQYADMLRSLWNDYLPRLESARKDLPFALSDAYTIVLTQYGTAGSYFPDENKIIINRIKKGEDTVLGTLIHEIVHIHIDHLIKKHHLSHWRKERLVDLICNEHFSDIQYMQKIPEDVSAVDVAFKENYPDLETITRTIGSEKPA